MTIRARIAPVADPGLFAIGLHARDCLGARRGVTDQLRKHRIVEDGHVVAGVNTVVVAHARPLRKIDVADQAGRRREVTGRIFGVDAAFDRVSARRHPVVCQRDLLPARDSQLFLHEIDAPHHLGDRMLDLQARVHLEEVELPIGSHQHFDGSGGVVIDCSGRADCRFAESSAQRLIDDSRWTLLHDFLMPALQRAFALADVDDRSVAIAQDLNFDVAWGGDEFLGIDRAIAEK